MGKRGWQPPDCGQQLSGHAAARCCQQVLPLTRSVTTTDKRTHNERTGLRPGSFLPSDQTEALDFGRVPFAVGGKFESISGVLFELRVGDPFIGDCALTRLELPS